MTIQRYSQSAEISRNQGFEEGLGGENSSSSHLSQVTHPGPSRNRPHPKSVRSSIPALCRLSARPHERMQSTRTHARTHAHNFYRLARIGAGGGGAHVTNLTSLRMRAMRRMRRILRTRMTRALLSAEPFLPALRQSCGTGRRLLVTRGVAEVEKEGRLGSGWLSECARTRPPARECEHASGARESAALVRVGVLCLHPYLSP